MSRLGELVARWREGRERLDEAEAARAAGPQARGELDLDELDGETIRIKTPGPEQAEELVDVLRKHGVAGDLRRPHGSEVEVVCPDGTAAADALRSAVDAVELWLLLDHTPDAVEVRCGKQTLDVRRPDAAAGGG